MNAALVRFADTRAVRYGFASVAALAADMASFLVLLAIGVPAAGASAIGYSLGILAHWLMSSRTVFASNVAAPGPARRRQKALFVVSALVGLALTIAIVGLGAVSGIDPRVAKLGAVAMSFAVTWLLRAKIVFRGGPAGT